MGERKLNPDGQGIFFAMEEWCRNNRVAINEVTSEIQIEDEVISSDDLFIYLHAVDHKLKAVQFNAFINSRWMPKKNPLQDYILNLSPFSGDPIQEVINSLIVESGVSEGQFSPEYAGLFLKKWLVGMVATLFDGLPNVLMPVLIGEKSIGKTWFFRNLLPKGMKQYYAESRLDQGKDSEAILSQKALVLNDELDGWTKTTAETFRNLISSDYYTYRPPYGRRSITRKRLASIAGTSNRSDIVYDHKNNRRIVPIEITDIKWEEFNAIDKQGLICQCYMLMLENFKYELTKDEIKMLENVSKQNVVRTAEMDLIEKYFEPPGSERGAIAEKMSAGSVLEYLRHHTHLVMHHSMIGRALTALEYPYRRGPNGNKLYLLVKTEMQSNDAS